MQVKCIFAQRRRNWKNFPPAPGFLREFFKPFSQNGALRKLPLKGCGVEWREEGRYFEVQFLQWEEGYLGNKCIEYYYSATAHRNSRTS